MEYTYMHNGYYRVFVGQTQPITYSVYRRSWHPEKTEKKKLLLWFGIGLTLLMLGAIIPLSVLYKRDEKTANEGLQDKLKRLCNPANFIKQYDKDKVEKANAIYQQLLTGNLDNEKLMALQSQAVNELGITLIDNQLLKRLKEKVNPQRYMKPYDAEKDTIAIQNTHVSQHIDWTNILYFEDMNFDGEKELVVCGHPRPNRSLEEDYIDCEDFTVYEKTKSGFCQIHNLVFDELSEGLCRTGFSFDMSQNTITLTGYLGDGGFERKTYYCTNGDTFKVTYSYLNHDGAQRYDYQFNLPDDIEEFQNTKKMLRK